MKSSSRFFFTLLASVTLLSSGLFYPESTLGRHSNPTAQTAQTGPSVSSSLDKIVESFRKIIILLDDEATLSQEQRARYVDAGRKIHQEKQNLLDDLTASLTADLHRAGESRFRERAERVESFIGYFSNNTALRDADRLAFVDLADELLAAVTQEESNAGISSSGIHKSLQKINDDLKSIQNAYQKEVARVFSALGTRGTQPKREKWQDYVKFLKSLFDREQVLKQYGQTKAEQENSEQEDEATRGARRDSKTEIYGYDLPAKSIVLTFDDGPHPRYTDAILMTLKKYNARALFFDVGKNLGTVNAQNEVKLSTNSNVSRRVLEAGHLLANHSYSHPDLTKLSTDDQSKEINNTILLLEKVIGAKPTLFRPPYGAKNSVVRKEVESLGLKSILWTIDSMDWADPISESIVQRVLAQIAEAKKGVLLMHDIHKQSVAALPRILEELNKQGYTFMIFDGDKFVTAASTMASARSNSENSQTTQTATANETKKGYYQDSWAVIIGINDYQKWPKLRYCVNDANSIEQMLTGQYGFKKSNIIKLLDQDATRERIVWALGDQLSDPNRVKRDDRVFVFYAGHGATRKLPSGKDMGYLVPVDAEAEASQAKSVSMAQLQEFCELIPAKHLYFVMDSCYSGLALTRGGGASHKNANYLAEITRRTARQILTAGGADQQVADNGPGGHSIFTWTLLQGLQGLADTDGNGAITASELGAYISPIVSSVSHQTPAFGNLTGSEGGEFVFELQQESLTETSKQLDEEAVRLNDELERIQKEIASKRERNAKLRGKVEEEQAKLNGSSAASLPRSNQPKSRTARAQEHHNLGLKYYREKKYDEAVKELEEAVKLDSRNATIVNNLGFTLFKIGKYEESINRLQKAIEIDPNRIVAYVNLADAYLKAGKTAEARKYYEKYAELAPNSSSIEYVRNKLEELKPSN
jgi:peptidoglycan/xylan/chitin deacetylase (PgdA/CDA1 family)/uncharacterized caspase-like protein/regulator of sirC expression with transglutaminase-like and TPR domain